MWRRGPGLMVTGCKGRAGAQVRWTAGVTAQFAGWDLLLGTGSPAGSPGVGEWGGRFEL